MRDNAAESAYKRCPKGSFNSVYLFVASYLLKITKLHILRRDLNAVNSNKFQHSMSIEPNIMHEVIDKLQELSESVPVPLELPEFDQLVEVEEEILIPLPAELKEYLLNASDVVYGSIEPVTAADSGSHTYLPEVASYAWSIGLPREYIPICQLGDDFYCIDQQGEILFWQGDEFAEDTWESFWDWVEDIWLQQ